MHAQQRYPRMSFATCTTRGVTSLLTMLPRGDVSTTSVLMLTAVSCRVLPSTHCTFSVAGRPSGSRGVIGVPSAFRKSGQEPLEKPNACISSCTAITNWPSNADDDVSIIRGQKLAWPRMGRSVCSSRTHLHTSAPKKEVGVGA